MNRLVPGLLALVVAGTAASCGGSSGSGSTTSAPATPAASPPASTLTLPSAPQVFSEYAAVPLTGLDAPVYPGPSTPHSLAGVEIAPSVLKQVKEPAVTSALTGRGFAVTRGGFALFNQAYDGNSYEGWPVYVTTDAAYNSWHEVFDKTLRDLEQQVLLPKLERLLTTVLHSAHAQARQLRKTALGPDAARAEQLYELAAAEVGLPVTLGPLARQEKALVDAHAGTHVSPLLGRSLDYSLFTPRGHYTLDAALTRYFVAMSVLGQLGFCLPGTQGCPSGVGVARIGMLASFALTNAPPQATTLWQDIYEPTAFLVGFSDDYTPADVSAAADRVPASKPYPQALASDAVVKKVVAALEAARPVRIDPGSASIRIMGSRFVVDSYLLDQLLYPHVGTAAKPRLLPSGLDVGAAFGSTAAESALKAAGVTAEPHYAAQLAKVQAAVAARPADGWGSTVYDAWLAALQPVFTPHGTAFPDYMRTSAWAAKDLQSGLGSYAELRHDTILYAKQLFAEGGDEPSKTVPRNWVEPDPAAFERLAAAADLLEQGLLASGLLTSGQAGLLTTEIDLLRFFGRMAGDELAGRTIGVADNSRLRYIGGELEALWWRTSLQKGNVVSDPDAAAIVVDLASSPSGVLELATGRIDRIYVLVPGFGGRFEVALGGVYSYYEFTSPPDERLSDADWHTLLNTGKAPARPAWEGAFRVSG